MPDPRWLTHDAKRWANQHASPETRRAYARDLGVYYKFLRDNGLEVALLNEDDITSFRDYLVETFSPNGAARTWTTVRTFERYIARGLERYFNRVKAPRRVKNMMPKVPTDADVDALIRAASNNWQDSLIIALLLNGLRAGEIGTLRQDSIMQIQDRAGSVSAIVLKVLGKGLKERIIPATMDAQRALNRFRNKARHYVGRSPYLIPDRDDGRPLTYRQVEHAVYKYGIHGMHPHALRHHYATRLIRAGVSVLHVQRLLGHADVSTTQAYVTLYMDDLIEAAKKDPMNQPRLEVVPDVVPEPLDPWPSTDWQVIQRSLNLSA